MPIALSAPPAPFVPQQHHFAPGVAVIVVGFGTPEEHAAALAPVREALDPLFDAAMPIPYVALQQMLDDGAFWGVRAYTKGLYLDELPDAAIDTIAERLAGIWRKTSQKRPSVMRLPEMTSTSRFRFSTAI